MPAPAEPLLRHIRRLIARPDEEASSDAALLQRFVQQRDEAAFAALLARHGPMVYGVCRRALRDVQDAEDVFQATFLVLARKADSLRRPETLSAWLHGTARRLALTSRRAAARRRERESRCPEMVPPPSQMDPLDELSAREWLLGLDEEMGRLPERYRLPLLLCGVQGRGQEEAARILGWTAGSLKGRLERGRKQLHARLTRRGLAFSGAVLALGASQGGSVNAAAILTSATLEAALAFARGEHVGITATVLNLAETGIASMTMTKAKVGVALLLVMSLVAGTSVVVYPGRTEKQPEEKQAEKPTSPKPEAAKRARTDRHGDPLPPGAIARIGTLRFRHSSYVSSVSYSPDGKILAAIGTDAIRLWDAATGKELHSYDRHGVYNGGFFASDGRRLWLQSLGLWQNSPGKVIYVWNLTPAPEKQPKKAPFDGKDLLLLAASPDGKSVAIGDKNSLRICDTTTGEDSRRLKTSAYRAQYSADGKLLAFLDGKSIILWNVQTGEEIRTFQTAGPLDRFRNLALAPNGKTVAAICDDNGTFVRLWDAATGKEMRTLQIADSSPRAMAFSPDNKVLVVAGQEMLRAWNVSSGKVLWERAEYGNQFYSVAFSPDSKRLAAGLSCGVRQYDVQTGKERPDLTAEGRIFFLRLLGDGRTVASAVWGKPLRLWRLPRGEEIPPTAGGKRPTVPEVEDVSLDGKWMASRGHKDGAIRIWDIASGAEVRRLPAIKSPVCSFSPDGRWLQAHNILQNPTSGKSEHVSQFWDARTGKMMSELWGDRASVAVFSPDSRLYATQAAERGFCYLGSVPDGSLVQTIAAPNGLYRFSFSADGRWLVGANTSEIPPRRWEVTSGKEIIALADKDEARSSLGKPGFCNEAAFSPDGRRLISGDSHGELFCWDVEGRLLRRWKGDSFPIRFLSFTPDGKLLITGGETTALVWNVDEVLPPEERQTTILAAADLNALWSDLKAEDATKAYRAIWRQAAAPDQAIPFLRERLRPAREPDKTNAERIIKLIGDLDNDAFAVREKAGRELATFGKEAEPALRKALASDPSAESKRRIEELLRKLPESLPSPPPEQLRQLRALAVLEYTGTDGARELLKTLSQGHAEARLTQEAKAVLERLNRRAAPNP